MLARAKVNLYLHITGKRADGYHLLDSLIVFADAGDAITAAESERVSLSIDGPFAAGLETGPENLVLRAAAGLQELAGTRRGAAVRLTKNLPIASGIGGGSADAAATLRLLGALWRVAPSEAALMELAARLGADVPVCLAGRPSFVGGVGEEITPAGDLPACWLLLVNPRVATPTPAVFKARRGAFSAAARWHAAPRGFAELAAHLASARNDLTEAAISVTPRIEEVLSAIRDLPGCALARLSGSGATCFGLFADEAAAQGALARMRASQPGWWSIAAPLAR